MRGGAFLNGKEGRVGFRKNSTVGRFPPSLLRFLSPMRGTERVVKTIEKAWLEVELSLQERRRGRKIANAITLSPIISHKTEKKTPLYINYSSLPPITFLIISSTT